MTHPIVRRGALALVGVLSLAPAAAQAQTSLGQPAATFPEDFGTIQTVRELPDGRLLIADPLGKELYLVDMAAGTREVVGRQGQGPQEYLQPDAVWPMPGDSTLLVDLGNGRVVILGPDLSFGPTSPIALTDPSMGGTLVLALPQGVDGEGRIYTRALGGGMGELPDSAAILRVERATGAADTVANFKLPDRTQTRSGGPGNQNVSITNVPLSGEDAWGVAADGSVAVVRTGDYHVDWFRPDGTVVRGAPVPFRAVGIGTPEKREHLAEVGRAGGGIGIGVEVNNGNATMTFARGAGGASDPDNIDRLPWPDDKPPFYTGRVPIDGAGRAWVRRHMDAGEPTTYDVFDGTGDRVGTYTLENGKRIVGFGSRWVYVVAFDEFDLNYLERYALPMG